MSSQSPDDENGTHGQVPTGDALFTRLMLKKYGDELRAKTDAPRPPPDDVHAKLLQALAEEAVHPPIDAAPAIAGTPSRMGHSRVSRMFALAASVVLVSAVGGAVLVGVGLSSDSQDGDRLAGIGDENGEAIRGGSLESGVNGDQGIADFLVTVDLSESGSQALVSRVWLPGDDRNADFGAVVLVPETSQGVAESAAREFCSTDTKCIVATLPEGAFSGGGLSDAGSSNAQVLLEEIPEILGQQELAFSIWAVDESGQPVAGVPSEVKGLRVVTSLGEVS